MTRKSKQERLKSIGVTVGIVLFVTTLCLAISWLSVMRTRRTEPYKTAVDLALNDPRVQQALGTPVTVGWLPQGAVNTANGGEAELNIPLEGPLGSATIRVNATNQAGSWKYWTIRVDTDQGERIDLLHP